ncbi:hypothetical protein FD03_GL000228 [Companilactobacillus nodensis DSM 19682 = JCM 14932 = NBRC 107160]|uniref:Uncharacterized protein n=1 Tax=Companilactobacillus nodensis DSM 19682 = JCM 14932 = NBRC 107160 TaxID=1423775 RepID=A0A0R1KEZ0_9LACO|nr:hypothetical protein FD03_GL000228 [Companilactobacillus nodensis DSM 19682 = JCM 14932 = NBRC 107160]
MALTKDGDIAKFIQNLIEKGYPEDSIVTNVELKHNESVDVAIISNDMIVAGFNVTHTKDELYEVYEITDHITTKLSDDDYFPTYEQLITKQNFELRSKWSRQWSSLDVYCASLAGFSILFILLELFSEIKLSVVGLIMWLITVILILIPVFVKLNKYNNKIK